LLRKGNSWEPKAGRQRPITSKLSTRDCRSGIRIGLLTAAVSYGKVQERHELLRAGGEAAFSCVWASFFTHTRQSSRDFTRSAAREIHTMAKLALHVFGLRGPLSRLTRVLLVGGAFLGLALAAEAQTPKTDSKTPEKSLFTPAPSDDLAVKTINELIAAKWK